jgi:hypothetical protein
MAVGIPAPFEGILRAPVGSHPDARTRLHIPAPEMTLGGI